MSTAAEPTTENQNPPPNGATEGGEAEGQTKKRRSFKERMVARMVEIVDEIGQLHESLLDSPCPEVQEALVNATKSLRFAGEAFGKLPDKFKPVVSTPPAAEISVGDKVQIAKKFHEKFAELLGEAVNQEMTVKALHTKQVACKTSDGQTLFIPKGQLKRVTPAAKA